MYSKPIHLGREWGKREEEKHSNITSGPRWSEICLKGYSQPSTSGSHVLPVVFNLVESWVVSHPRNSGLGQEIAQLASEPTLSHYNCEWNKIRVRWRRLEMEHKRFQVHYERITEKGTNLHATQPCHNVLLFKNSGWLIMSASMTDERGYYFLFCWISV